MLKKRDFPYCFSFLAGQIVIWPNKTSLCSAYRLPLSLSLSPVTLLSLLFKHVAIFCANRKCFSGNLILKSVLPANKWDYVLPKVHRTLTCPGQLEEHIPSLPPLPFYYSFLLLLPWAIEALKNAKNYISKQAKWKETLTKLLPPALPCLALDRSRCMSYEIIIWHIHRQTYYVWHTG